MNQKLLTLNKTYEQKQKNRVLIFILVSVILFFEMTAYADVFDADDFGIYGITSSGNEQPYVRGPFVDILGSMIQKISQAEITEGNLYSAFDAMDDETVSKIEGLSSDSDTTLNELNGGTDSDSSFLDSVTSMMIVWFDTDSSGEISTVGMGGDSADDMEQSYDSLSDLIQQVNSTTRTVGIALIIIFFCISFMQGYLDGNQYEEIAVKKLVILGMSIALIYYIQVICAELSNLVNLIIQSYTSTSNTSASEDASTMYARAYIAGSFLKSEDGAFSFFNNVGKFIVTLARSFSYLFLFAIPWLITIICEIMMKVTCLSRFIEMVVLIAMAPIAMCTLGTGRGLDSAMRFIKAFLTVCLQGAVMFLSYETVALMKSTLLTDVLYDSSSLNDMFNSLLTLALVCVVQAGIISKSRSIAQTIVGN